MRNESQCESRKRVAGELLPEDLIKFLITDAEKSRFEEKPSEPKAKKKQGGKTAGRYFESPYCFELPEGDIPMKFSPCIYGVIQVKLSSN